MAEEEEAEDGAVTRRNYPPYPQEGDTFKNSQLVKTIPSPIKIYKKIM